MERRLAAILAADVVGYSRLMGEDEAGTLARLEGLRAEVLDPLIAQHQGRVVKLMGDGFLVEFASVVDALACALAWQEAVETRADLVPEARRLRFRIGVNLGDVMVRGDDLHGDGVNVAARLEGLAEPGSVLVSRTVFNHARGKLEASFEDLGEQALKNIAEPVRIFRVTMGSEVASAPARPASRSRRLPVIAAVGALLVVAAGTALWQRPWESREEPASLADMAFPLPDKPSIAVLPFNNMSDDASQEYFADGMTEDLITDLSKISGLFVIARNSSFSYKGRQVKVRQVAEELGVRYVLEGSVRRAGDEVRINAQLIDATTGGHLWAERYDGTLDDVFDLQDRVTERIVAALAVSLTGEEQARQLRHDTENTQAHDAYLQGWAHYKLDTKEGLANAIPLFEEAIRLDPDHTRAYAALASLYWDVFNNEWAFDLGMPSFRPQSRANEYLEKAFDAPTTLAHILQSRMLAASGFLDEAVAEAEKAVALDGNDATALAGLADSLIKADRADEGLGYIEQAMRLDPHHPPSYLIILGAAQLGMEDFEAAAATFERAVKRNPENEIPFIYLASAYGHQGRIEDADDTIERANDLRNLVGLGELSIREVRAYSVDDFDAQINFARFGSKPIQELVRAGLTEIPALKWQYLVTAHRVLGPGNSWLEVEGATKIDVSTAKSLYDRGVLFVDVGSQSMRNAGHIPGAVHLPFDRTGDPSRVRLRWTTLREIAAYNDEIVITFGYLDYLDSQVAWEAAKAVAWGYSKVYHLDGGARVWKEAGHPIETGQ